MVALKTSPQVHGITVITPCSSDYLESVTAVAENMASLTGMGPRAKGRSRLLAEELFMHITSQCSLTGHPGQCRLDMTPKPDGLEMCFTTDHLAYDPQKHQDYALDSVLDKGEAQGLGLHLVKTYAQSITLTQKGREQKLCLLIASGEGDLGSRSWSRLIPSLSPHIKLSPMEHEGRRIHRLDDSLTGKSYRVRSLAHHILASIDGQNNFARIMAQTLKVMPESSWHEVEDLFEVLIEKKLVEIKTVPRQVAKLKVRKQLDANQMRAMDAYRKASEED